MSIGIPASLVLSVASKDDENDEFLDRAIRLRVSDFILLPIGSQLSFHDGDICLFESGIITEYLADNHFDGLLVEVTIGPGEMRRLTPLCRQARWYCAEEYPNTISFFKG